MASAVTQKAPCRLGRWEDIVLFQTGGSIAWRVVNLTNLEYILTSIAVNRHRHGSVIKDKCVCAFATIKK